jgi:hypothetical protein
VVSAGLFILLKKILNPDDTRTWITYLTGAVAASAISTVVITIIVYVIGANVLGVTVDPSRHWLVPVVIFLGLGAAFYLLFRKLASPATAADIVTYGASAVAGSMTNTICVLGGVFLFFGRDYAQVMQIGYDAMMDVIGLSVVTNGVPEAAVSALCAYFIARVIVRRRKRGQL